MLGNESSYGRVCYYKLEIWDDIIDMRQQCVLEYMMTTLLDQMTRLNTTIRRCKLPDFLHNPVCSPTISGSHISWDGATDLLVLGCITAESAGCLLFNFLSFIIFVSAVAGDYVLFSNGIIIMCMLRQYRLSLGMPQRSHSRGLFTCFGCNCLREIDCTMLGWRESPCRLDCNVRKWLFCGCKWTWRWGWRLGRWYISSYPEDWEQGVEPRIVNLQNTLAKKSPYTCTTLQSKLE